MHVAYLARFRPLFADGRALESVERVFTVDVYGGGAALRAPLVAAIEEHLTGWGKPLGWVGVLLSEVRYLGGAVHLETLPDAGPGRSEP